MAGSVLRQEGAWQVMAVAAAALQYGGVRACTWIYVQWEREGEDEALSTTGMAPEVAVRAQWYGRVIVGGDWRCRRCLTATAMPAAA